MKLKTEFQDEDFRKGEVADVSIATIPDSRIVARAKAKSGGEHTFYYDCIEALYNDWSDYEEPKKHYEILAMGTVMEREDAEDEIFRNQEQREIGNYFSSREEAERAVEKLKAFANLRKRGLKFNGWTNADRGMVGEFEIYCDALELDGIEQELEAVFGREEA